MWEETLEDLEVLSCVPKQSSGLGQIGGWEELRENNGPSVDGDGGCTGGTAELCPEPIWVYRSRVLIQSAKSQARGCLLSLERSVSAKQNTVSSLLPKMRTILKTTRSKHSSCLGTHVHQPSRHDVTWDYYRTLIFLTVAFLWFSSSIYQV